MRRSSLAQSPSDDSSAGSVLGIVPQRVFGFTGVAIGLWVATFGVITIVRPASAPGRPGPPISPRVARVIGASAVLLGLVVGIGASVVYSEPRCERCAHALWGVSSSVTSLMALLGLLLVFTGIVWAKRRRR